jgi:uncharacterized protein with HEPN domain
MPFRDWQLRVRDILEAIERIDRSTTGMNFEDFTQLEEIIQQGILYNFMIIGEAAVNVPDKIKERDVPPPQSLAISESDRVA